MNDTSTLDHRLREPLASARNGLREGVAPSVVVDALISAGLTEVEIIYVLYRVTEATLGQAKGLSAWWDKTGVTDADSLNEEMNGFLAKKWKPHL